MPPPDRFVAVDFAPERRAGRPHLRILAITAVVVMLGVLVAGVTQLLLR